VGLSDGSLGRSSINVVEFNHHYTFELVTMSSLTQEEQLKLISDLEIEMMADMYNRLSYGRGHACVGDNVSLLYRHTLQV